MPKIEAVKAQRVPSRLVGEFEWSLFQRGYDGVRVDWRNPKLQATSAVLRPTQGGFEDAANLWVTARRSLYGYVLRIWGRDVVRRTLPSLNSSRNVEQTLRF